MNVAKEAEVEAAVAVESAKEHLAKLRVLKKKKKAGGTKSQSTHLFLCNGAHHILAALQDAENRLSSAMQLHADCLDSVKEKEALLLKALSDIPPIPTCAGEEASPNSANPTRSESLPMSMDNPTRSESFPMSVDAKSPAVISSIPPTANPTQSESLPMGVDAKSPTVIPSIPPTENPTHSESLPMSMDAKIIAMIPSLPPAANPTDSVSLPMGVDATSPAAIPSLPPAPMNPSSNATIDEPLIPQAHSSPNSVHDIPPTDDADQPDPLPTCSPPSRSLLDTAAHTFPQTQTHSTSQADSPTGNDMEVNMHPVEGGRSVNIDLKKSFNELVESAERNLTSQPGGIFQRHQSVLHGYESTLAAHKADLRRHEAYFTGVSKGEGVPQDYERWFVNKYLEIAAEVMNTARTAIEKGEKLLHGYKAHMDAELRSSTLVEALHICRNRMTARGSELSDVAKWKTLLHYTEDELMKTDAEAVAVFQSGRKRQDDDDFEDDEDVKPKIEAGFSDKKTPAPEKFREDWLDMSETQQEEVQGMTIHTLDLRLLIVDF